jgi:hypothetical protein
MFISSFMDQNLRTFLRMLDHIWIITPCFGVHWHHLQGVLFNCTSFETHQVITSTYWLHIIGSQFSIQNAQLWISCKLLTILIDIDISGQALMTVKVVCVENCDLVMYGQVSAWNHLMCFEKLTVNGVPWRWCQRTLKRVAAIISMWSSIHGMEQSVGQ